MASHPKHRSGLHDVDARSDTRTQGFIHCSFAEQVDRILEEHYRDVDDVLVLTIDTELLDAEVKVEDLHNSGEAFPHIYGPIPINAVTSVNPWVEPG